MRSRGKDEMPTNALFVVFVVEISYGLTQNLALADFYDTSIIVDTSLGKILCSGLDPLSCKTKDALP